MVDNQGAIDLVGNPVHHRRTKHIEVRFHIARTARESGEILVIKVHTSDNHADILTKGTAGSIFRRHVSAIMHSRSHPRHDVVGGGVRIAQTSGVMTKWAAS